MCWVLHHKLCPAVSFWLLQQSDYRTNTLYTHWYSSMMMIHDFSSSPLMKENKGKELILTHVSVVVYGGPKVTCQLINECSVTFYYLFICEKSPAQSPKCQAVPAERAPPLGPAPLPDPNHESGPGRRSSTASPASVASNDWGTKQNLFIVYRLEHCCSIKLQFAGLKGRNVKS